MRPSAFAALAAATTLLAACSPSTPAASSHPSTGSLHVALTSGAGTGLATIVVQSVFSPGQAYLIDCPQKPHSASYQDAGLQTFCDELTVLPPGVYELIVQSQDPSCHSELNHYKVVVEAGKTSELLINMVCGSNNGALDVIVREEFKPGIDHIDFNFADGGVANKFICQCGDLVTVSALVSDQDNTCDQLTGTWTNTDSAGADVSGSTLILPGTPTPDLTLTAASVELLDADAGTAQLTFQGTGEVAAWLLPDGGSGGTLVDWSLTWSAATGTGTITVTDTDLSGTANLSGTVSDLSYTLAPEPGGYTAIIFADLLLQPNALGLPAAPLVSRFSANAQLAENPDYAHLTGTGIVDIYSLQLPGTPTDGGCEFTVTVDPSIPPGDYSLSFTATDPSGLSGSFTFPLHLVDCGYTCPGQ